jgi:hypothetical protein
MAASAQAGVSIPFFQPDEKRHRRDIATWSQWVNQGHLQNTGTVTLTAGGTSTVVTDSRVGVNTVPVLQPATANAASAIASVYVSTVGNGSFTITHASSGSSDKTFRYALLG